MLIIKSFKLLALLARILQDTCEILNHRLHSHKSLERGHTTGSTLADESKGLINATPLN